MRKTPPTVEGRLTIATFRVQPGVDVARIHPLVGIVEFGNGSAFSAVEFDIAGGQMFSLSEGVREISVQVPAEEVRFFVRDEATRRTWDPAREDVGVSTTLGWHSEKVSNTRLFRSFVSLGENGVFNVPTYATSVRVFSRGQHDMVVGLRTVQLGKETAVAPPVVVRRGDMSPIELSGLVDKIIVDGVPNDRIAVVFEIGV